MAGRPKTRAKIEAAKAAAVAEHTPPIAEPGAPIPSAVTDGETARTYVRTRAWPSPARSSPAPGPELRSASDAAQAQAVRGLHEHIRPGVTLRLIRTRPAWAAGWVEDLVVDDNEDLTDVYEHVSSEHGGNTYQVTALSSGHPIYEGRISIAGKPRHHGKLVSRRQWQGLDEDEPASRAPQASSSGGELMNGLGSFLQLFMEQQRQTAQAQLESVRQMTEQAAQTQRELVAAVVSERERERESGKAPTFAEQLGEFVEASSALEKAKKRFGAAAGESKDDDTSALTKVAMEGFMSRVAESFMSPAQSRQQPPPPAASTIRSVPQAKR